MWRVRVPSGRAASPPGLEILTVRGETPDDIRGRAPSYFLPPDSYRRGTGNRVDQGNGVTEMTAVISRERARTTGLTAAAGALMLAVAFVMMVVAAPGHGHVQAHLAKPSAVRLATDVCGRPRRGRFAGGPGVPGRPALAGRGSIELTGPSADST